MDQIPMVQVPGKPRKVFSVPELLLSVVLLSVILYFGKALFIPLSIAMLISFVLYPVCAWMESKGINKSIAIGIAMLVLTLLIAGIVYLLIYEFSGFVEEWPSLKGKLYDMYSRLSLYLSENLNISLLQQQAWVKNMADNSGAGILPFLSTTVYSLSVTFVLLILIPILSSLILYHRQLFAKALYSMFPIDMKETVREVLVETIHTYHNFIKGMFLVYLIVGVLNSIGLAILGIPNPILFGFIASILTFIPYVGIIIASLLPIAVSWITYDSVYYPLGVILVFTIVQYLEANVIFPFAVSSRLKVNTLATIVAIISGGILWGGVGMVIFIPFLGILKLIADKTDRLKSLSILLGTS